MHVSAVLFYKHKSIDIHMNFTYMFVTYMYITYMYIDVCIYIHTYVYTKVHTYIYIHVCIFFVLILPSEGVGHCRRGSARRVKGVPILWSLISNRCCICFPLRGQSLPRSCTGRLNHVACFLVAYSHHGPNVRARDR